MIQVRQPKNRQNIDNNINNHGKQLINICKNTDLRILNGRTKGDSFGRPTFHGKNGVSTVDYIICNQTIFQNTHFIVKPPNYLSDHSQIVAWLDICIKSDSDENNQTHKPKYNLPPQFIWEENSKHFLRQTLKSTEFQVKLKRFLDSDFIENPEGINNCVSEFEDMIIDASKRSCKIKKKKHRRKLTNIANKKWFDGECRIQRHQLRKLANQKHREPTNTYLRDTYHNMLKTYKQTLKRKKDKFHEDKISEIIKATETDLNTFWKVLKTTSDNLETKSKDSPKEDELLNHFQQLHSTHNLNIEHDNIIENLKSIERSRDQFEELDAPITENELMNKVKKIKLKKATYSDRISNKIIKSSFDILIKGFIKVFNLILKSGNFPKAWCEGLITPIFKSGNYLDPNNYRGICVSSCLGKLFCMILNERLMSHVQDKELIHPSQIGFMPGSRTTDHILTLKTIHDKYVNQQKNGKIYACFVDFRKAFDSVWHEGLFLKLLKNKIGGRFYDLIKSLYSNTQCAIKCSDHRTTFFPYKRGVRQGCTLSPLLFNIYVNELPKIFQETSSDPFVLPDGTTVSSLIYADDLVVLSKSKNGLQNCLNKLYEWSRGELGKFPLLIPMLKRTLNYINHLNQLPEKAIAKQAFLLSKALHNQGKESFYSNILKSINSYYDTNDKPITDLETKIENSGSIEIIKNVKDTYISLWKKEISKSTKLSFYSTFKKDYKLEDYLTKIPLKNQRRIFTQFRISNHKLKVEYGCYQNLPRDERLCKNCNIEAVEDEYHFIFDCQCYEAERNNSNNILKYTENGTHK